MKSLIQLFLVALRNASVFAVAVGCFLGASAALPGQFDPSFGSERATPYRPAGVVADWQSSPQFTSYNTISTALVKRKDGSVIVANVCPRDNPSVVAVCLHALSAAGAAVTTFGTLGRVDFDASFSSTRTLALDRQENIWLGGVCSGSACLLRLSPTGVLFDRLGATANLTQAPIAGMASANSIDMTFDDKIYVGGACPALGTSLPCAIRMNSNGTPDSTFNGGNVLIWGNDSDLGGSDLTSGEVSKIKAYGDGRAYAAGNCRYTTQLMCVAVIETNGTLQLIYTGNSQDGIDVTRFYFANFALASGAYSSAQVFRDMVVQTDGSVVMLGRCTYVVNPQTNRDAPCLTKVRADMQRDPLFGSNGYLAPYASRDDVDPLALVMREDGAMIVASNCRVTTPTRTGLCLSAHTAFGVPSKQFDGAVSQKEVEFDPAAAGNSLLTARLTGVTLGAARYDESALMTFGYCQDGAPPPLKACVARIALALPNVKSCLPDIDGDGKVSAMTDGLLMLRGMLGLSGDALTNKVVAAGATRNQAAIQTYLTDRCGLPVNQ
jgi:hypothetical protein